MRKYFNDLIKRVIRKNQSKFYVNTNKKTGAKTSRFYYNESDTK